MPLARPAAEPPPPTAGITIARGDVTGMAPGLAHEAILGALDAGVIAATSAAGMIDQAIIDAAVAALASARQIIETHAPFSLPEHHPGTFCEAEGATAGRWPCPTYRAAADTIADGLGR